uniref:hypothetical protein n=1 Tax=uncultured Veillonella sp. TaxID=159268 RepID=UPI0025FC6F7B|nr:hypothetical protein [uncultured Veillonella sp.]
MKFTKRMIVMTFLAMTAAVSTGFAYDYVCNGSQANCNTNAQYNCNADTQYNCNANAQYNCNNNNTVCNNTSQSYCGQNSNTRGCGRYKR